MTRSQRTEMKRQPRPQQSEASGTVGSSRAPYPIRSRAYVISLLWRLPLGLAAGFFLGALLSVIPVLGTLLGFWAGMEMALVPGVENGPLARWMDRNWVPYGQTKTRAQMRALASGDPDAVRRNADTYYVFDETPRRSLIDEDQLAAAIADALNRQARADESRRA
jgi:hypothetical protein